MNGPSQGTLPRVGAGEPAHSAEQNAETQQRRKMSLAKTLALNKRGKKDGNMQPCQPGWGIAGQRQRQRLAPRMGTRPGHVPGWKKAVFQPVGCAYWAWQGSRARKEEGRAGGPPWQQPAHQVTKVDVVQKLQPSPMDVLPACLKGHVAMLGQTQVLVLVLGACVLSHRVPSFPTCMG